MIRKRDVAAVIFAIALSHLVWNEQESLSATVRLAFYLNQSPFLSPMDIDGDGTPDSLVQLLHLSQDTAFQEKNQQTSWKFKVLSLPISKYNNNHHPQIPETILESTLVSPGNRSSAVSPPLEPLRMTVGHVLIPKRDSIRQRSHPQQQKDTTTSSTQQLDRTRHYFCGTDWHHAAQSCQTHCPTGRSSDCPDGQRCFADTPCDAQVEHKNPSMDDSYSSSDSRLTDTRNLTSTYALSPMGGLPSVMVLWSNAILTFHSWTAMRNSRRNDFPQEPAKQLQFETMWTLNLIPEQQVHFHVVSWIESTLQFVDAVDAGNDSGLVLVSATIEVIPHEQHPRFDAVIAHLTVAVHARTGQVVWREFQMSDDAIAAEHSLHDTPMVLRDVSTIGTSSVARRRSLIPDLHSTSTSNALLPEQHCMQSYFRRPLLTSTSSLPGEAALPFVYSSQQDASTRVLHFDLDQPAAHSHKSDKMKKNDNKKKNDNHHLYQDETNSKGKRHSKSTVLHGRPNVVVLHNQQGLQVRSFKNGRILCRLALNENALYADVNHDGTLESVQLALGTNALKKQPLQPEEADDDFRFIANLAQRVAEDEASKKTKIDVAAPLQRTSLCHLMVLSGMPSREELYSSHLCNGYLSPTNHQELRGVAPLLMEPMDGRKGWDIVVAINSGVVNRIHGALGRQLWRLKGRRSEHLLEGAHFPHWNEPARALLTRIDTIQTVPSTRPVLLAGENSLVLLSASTGKLLDSATFHQTSIRRPVLVDFDGDGTTDVLIHTKDAIWGYKIRIHTGSSVFLRILSGLLFMGVLLAFLRNRFGPQPGKRSTDALATPRI